MKKFIAIVVMLVSFPVYAGGNINECVNCSVIYEKKVVRKVVKQYVPVPAPVYAGPPEYAQPFPIVTGPIRPVPVAPMLPEMPAPVVPTYSYVPTPEASSIYTPPGYPSDIPVATNATGSCAMYVDPYDLFGQLFGGADLVQSCWTRVY